jgi:hypothetical protein
VHGRLRAHHAAIVQHQGMCQPAARSQVVLKHGFIALAKQSLSNGRHCCCLMQYTCTIDQLPSDRHQQLCHAALQGQTAPPGSDRPLECPADLRRGLQRGQAPQQSEAYTADGSPTCSAPTGSWAGPLQANTVRYSSRAPWSRLIPRIRCMCILLICSQSAAHLDLTWGCCQAAKRRCSRELLRRCPC